MFQTLTLVLDGDSRLCAGKKRLMIQDVMMVPGDWDAHPGPLEGSTGHILGLVVLGRRCRNGSRLVNFADLNKLAFCRTSCQHPQNTPTNMEFG